MSEVVRSSNPLCAACGEHANEHGAISHEFVAQDSKPEIDRIIKTVKTWPVESPPTGTYQNWIAKLVAEVEKLRVENTGLKRELGMLDDAPSDETVVHPPGHEPWRLYLPVITVQMLADYGQEGFMEQTVEPVKGIAGVTWSQAAVDFACMLQGQLQERLQSKAPACLHPADQQMVGVKCDLCGEFRERPSDPLAQLEDDTAYGEICEELQARKASVCTDPRGHKWHKPGGAKVWTCPSCGATSANGDEVSK
jgi:hypothetical protein